MNRIQVLLATIAGLLVVVLFFVFVFQPQRDEVADIEAQVDQERQQQVDLQSEIERLRSVREDAPEVEAELAASEAIVPADAALPAALRQLQTAADESELTFESVTTTRPEAVEDAPGDLHSIQVSVQLSGAYFQVVDFLRRVEDPSITPRGLTWSGATIARGEYPTLSVTLDGSLYALIATPPPDEPDPADEPDEDDPDEDDPDDDPDAEIDAEIDVDDDASGDMEDRS